MDARLWHQQARTEPHPAPEPRNLAELRAMAPPALAEYLQRRRAWLSSLQFAFEEGARAKVTLTDLVSANAHRPPGAKDVIAVSAPFAVGKSTLVRDWAQATYRSILGNEIEDPVQPSWQVRDGVWADHVPIAWIDMVAAAKIKAFNTQVLRFLGYPVYGAIRDLTERVIDAVENHKVRALIVDDANLLNVRHRDARDVLDHLKHVNTLLGQRGASLILVGADLEDSPIFTDPQIAARLRIVRLHPFSVDTEAASRAWQAFLFSIEQVLAPYLPAADQYFLAGRFAPYIWRRTQGFVGDTARLVTEAAHLAAVDGAWRIEKRHLDKVALSARATAATPTAVRKPAGAPAVPVGDRVTSG